MSLRRLRGALGRLRIRGPGYVDRLDSERAVGWLAPPPGHAGPALVSLHVDGRHEMNIHADRERADVAAAGQGPLHCGFDVALPARLRDGAAHLVELRAGRAGPVLRGGRLTIRAGQAPAAGGAARAQGVVFLDRGNAALVGWATGCGAVSLRIDDGPERLIDLDRPVPGFGSGGRQGFQVPIPGELMDGRVHRAWLSVAGGGPMLDGSPVEFRLSPARPLIEVAGLVGRRLELIVRDPQGRRLELPIEVLADGQVLELHAGAPGGWLVNLPPAARHLVIRAAPGDDGAADDRDAVLARFAIGPDTVRPWPAADVPDDPEFVARARAAFAAFCAAPDGRFDAAWYVAAGAGCDDPAAALDHYRDQGAAAGRSPGPFFDEEAARMLHPKLAALVGAGELPCLFAAELVLGPGALHSLAGLAPELAPVLAGASDDPGAALAEALEAAPAAPPAPPPVPVPARLPAPAALSDPARSIYAAWLARLDIPPETRGAITEDEAGARREIASRGLVRTPLVSIIMPSWNRAFTIGEAIQSVLEQSYENWELLVCDDASEDRTSEVVHGFDDPRIRYMKFTKSNGAATRNKGLRMARGDYIAYLDSDNIWHPHFLDMMLRALAAHPGRRIAYSAYLDTEIAGARVGLNEVARAPFDPWRLTARNYIDLNSIVHHRHLHDWLGGFDERLPRLQDWDLVLRYTAIFRPVFVDRVGVFYRRNAAWGQVTHLFMNSDARDTVNAKTARRLNQEHDRLAIDWPGRGRVTVLAGSGVLDQRLAVALARLAADVADVDLVLTADAAAVPEGDPPGLRRHVLAPGVLDDPLRAGQVLAGLLAGRPVLSAGVGDKVLRALPVLTRGNVWCLDAGEGAGAVLRSLSPAGPVFHLGAVPLDLPDIRPAGAPLILVMPGDADEGALQKAATANRLALLLPPHEGRGWRVLAEGGARDLSLPAGADLPPELAQVALAVSMQPLDMLAAHWFSLLAALQGRGVVLAVLPDEGRSGAQMIAARAAYEIARNTPEWIMEKARKLLADQAALERLRAQGRVAWQVAHHPELVRQRLADALYQMMFEPPEVTHGSV